MPILDDYEPEDRGAEDDELYDDGDDYICGTCDADLDEEGMCPNCDYERTQ